MSADLCAPPATPDLAARLLADTDCQAFGLVERGYAALSAPGGSVATALTSLMVVAVALFGYRLLLGHGLLLSDMTRLVIRLGIVLLIASSWSTWQSVAYDTLARAPTRIAGELVVAIDAPAPLGGVQTALDRIEAGSVGWRTRAGIASPLVGGAPSAAMALNVSAFLLTISTIGLLVISRVVLALLLAIAPLMAGFLLFDTTRGLLEAWLRAMIATALVPLGVLTLCAVELAVLSPMLERMLAQQARGQFEASDVTPVSLVVIVFTLTILASTMAVGSIARGLRLSRSARAAPVREIPGPAVQPVLDRASAPDAAPMAAQLSVTRALESAARRDGAPEATKRVASLLHGFRETSSPVTRLRARTSAEAEAARNFVAPARNRNRHRNPRASRAASNRDS